MRSAVHASIVVIAAVLWASPAAAQSMELTPPLVTVGFASGSSALDSADRDQLRAVATWAHDHPWRLIVIEGYADPAGRASANLTLSQDRADAVRAALVALGISPQRLVSAAYGANAAGAERRVIVRGTLEDYRDIVEPTPPRAPATPPPSPQVTHS